MTDSPLRAVSRHRLGRPLPHQLAGSKYATLFVICIFNPNIASDSMGNYPTFRWAMSRKEVCSYSLLTRSPLNQRSTQKHRIVRIISISLCRPQAPFDLHVLGTSPAFTLSHDQTLSTTPQKRSFLSKMISELSESPSGTNSQLALNKLNTGILKY